MTNKLHLSLVMGSLLGMVACGGPGGERISLNHDLADISTVKGKQNSAPNAALIKLVKDNPACLQLDLIIKQIKASAQQEINLYVSNHDVGTEPTVTPSSGSRIEPLSDGVARAKFVFKTSAMPILLQTFDGPDLMTKSLLGDYLNVFAQTDCDSIQFNDSTKPAANPPLPPREFKIVNVKTPPKDAHGKTTAGISQGKLEMYNGSERRFYLVDANASHLYIHVQTPVSVSVTDGGTAHVIPAFEEKDFTLVLGNTSENFKLKQKFAALLKDSLASPPSELVSQLSAAPAVGKPKGDHVDVTYATFELIETAILNNEFVDTLK